MAYTIEEVILQPAHAIGIRVTVPVDALPTFFMEAFGELGAYVGQAGRQVTGPPFARFFSVDPTAVDVEAIFPVDAVMETRGRMQPIELSGGPAIQVLHVGPFDAMVPAYEAISAWLAANHRQPADTPREVYLSDPATEPDPATWRTLVVQPIV
jgi:effector-binding domain-containing protein